MKKASSPTRFLTLSLIVVAVLCILVFGFLALYMDSHNKDTINEVGAIYMTGMSERITMHFDTTIDYNLSQLQGVADAFPPDSAFPRKSCGSSLSTTPGPGASPIWPSTPRMERLSLFSAPPSS